MPHKVTTVDLVDEVTPTARIAGACNAILLRADGSLLGDMFDGAGFVRGVQRKGCASKARARSSSGAAASARRSPRRSRRQASRRSDCTTRRPCRRRTRRSVAQALSGARRADGLERPFRLCAGRERHPLGMNEGDPLPMDVSRISPSTLVGEVVMKQEMTPFLRAVAARGCRYQIGTDMLFEQIPAYLEFFGFPTTTPENLRAVAKIRY
jgi:shikimate dehydrogenase